MINKSCDYECTHVKNTFHFIFWNEWFALKEKEKDWKKNPSIRLPMTIKPFLGVLFVNTPLMPIPVRQCEKAPFCGKAPPSKWRPLIGS